MPSEPAPEQVIYGGIENPIFRGPEGWAQAYMKVEGPTTVTSFLDTQVREWLSLMEARAGNGGLRSSARNHLKILEYSIAAISANYPDLQVDTENLLVELGGSSLVVGVDSARVLKVAQSSTLFHYEPRLVDALVFETADETYEVDGRPLPIELIIQERLESLDVENPDHIVAFGKFLQDLHNGVFGERYYLMDFAAGINQFGYKLDEQGNMIILAVEPYALFSLAQLEVFPGNVRDGFIENHVNLIDELRGEK